MVAKISTGGNMFGALAYNQNKVDSGEAKVLFSNRMLLSEDGNFSIGECMRSFEMQMPVQLSTKKPILHISINPHPEDVLTDQQLSDIYADIDEHNSKASPEQIIKIDQRSLRTKIMRETEGVKSTWGKERKAARGAAEDLRGVFGLQQEDQ